MTHITTGYNMRQVRKQGADRRRLDRAERTIDEQIKVLDKRLGEGVGAKKERARLVSEPTSKAARKARRTKKESKK